MKNRRVLTCTGGGGSPEQSQEVVWSHEMAENYEQLSARRGRPRSFAQARTLAFSAKGGEPLSRRENQRCAFTMAEILLSLTIIGVVAAITLPSLTGNINERTWNTQRKALYARFSQAIALMPALNGYGTLDDTNDNAAETFVTDGLAKVLKINNICDSDHLADCGIVNSFTNMAGSQIENFPKTMWDLSDKFNFSFQGTGGVAAGGNGYTNTFSVSYSQMNTKAAAFETQNGESIAVFYNPYCQSMMDEQREYFIAPKICANFIYDLNGNKGPNTVGKDIGFITALYPTDTVVVAPLPLTRDTGAGVQQNAGNLCTSMDSESRVPNIQELQAMMVNGDLLGMNTGKYWSSSLVSAGVAWDVEFEPGYSCPLGVTWSGLKVRCIKR